MVGAVLALPAELELVDPVAEDFQMLIRVTDKQLTIAATDPVIVDLGRAALHALGDEADPPGTIRGDLPVSASLSNVWQALRDSLGVIQRRATLPSDSPGKPDHPGTEAA